MPSPRIARLEPLLFAVVLLPIACADTPEGVEGDPPSAQTIVERAIAAQGGDVLDHAMVTFNFRGVDFRIRRDGGVFSYTRTYRDSLGRTVREGLTNEGPFRMVNGQQVPLSPEERQAVAGNVNSVIYLALVPYFLQAPAVQAHYAGTDTIGGVPYYRVAVTFQQQGGGSDWQDRFMYWFDQADYNMDYFAYAYGLGPGEEPGTRFREAFNARRIAGVRLADYRNYTSDAVTPSTLRRYGDLLESGEVRLVSTVAIDSVQVQSLDE